MLLLSKSWGYNDRYGIEMSVFKTDIIDYETHQFDVFSFKVLFRLFGFNVYVVGLEINDSRTTVGLLSSFFTVFYR